MNVVLPAPFTPTTRMTVGDAGASVSRGVALAAAQRRGDPVGERRLKLGLESLLAALRASLDFLDEAKRDRHAEIRLEQQSARAARANPPRRRRARARRRPSSRCL